MTPGERIGPTSLKLESAGGIGAGYCAADSKLNREMAIEILPNVLGQRSRLARPLPR